MCMTRRFCIGILVGATLAYAAPSTPATAQNRNLLVFAAASLKNALDDIASQWQSQNCKKVVIS
jgi:molybdate transport system substrate-binding protein